MIIYRNLFEGERLANVKAAAEKFGLSEEFAKVLFGRGIDDYNKILRFLTPGKHNFYDPYLLAGMSEAVERIKLARENGEIIVVFGDYDADGICASTVLTRALKKFGVAEVYTVIPERLQGYGLTHDLVEETLETYTPDLVITVDCGVSCKDEVAFIEDVGVDVIVTDHHELPSELPDCTLINCKRKDQQYPFDGLCGAGVAYKLAYALIGDAADEYLDLVSIATIADSMPLTDENRDIVREGIDLIKRKPCKAVESLIYYSGLKEVNSTGLAFTVAPRINAAGRMGDARSALDMMLSDDVSEITDACVKLNEYNSARQSECDMLFRDAKRKLALKGNKRKAIVLADEKWNGGLVGIVAAKLVEEYNKPVVLFTANEGVFHGSARSVESVNVFKAIDYCKDLLVDFGGHAQAAGVTIEKQNIDAFEKKLSDYIEANYSDEVFEAKTYAEKLITEKVTADFVKELDMLEPVGTGNRKPLYAIKTAEAVASPIKPGSVHVSVKTPFIDLMYFNGAGAIDELNFPAQKIIAFEPNISTFKGNDYVKGFIRSFELDFSDDEALEAECFRRALLAGDVEAETPELIDNGAIDRLLDDKSREDRAFFAAFNPQTFNSYPRLKSSVGITVPKIKGARDAAVLCPNEEETRDFDYIIYLDEPPLGYFNLKGNVYRTGRKAFDCELSVERATFAEAFKELKARPLCGANSAEIACALKKSGYTGLSLWQIIFCLETFLQLKIFYISCGALRLDSKVKCELKNSALYRAVEEKTAKE